LDVTLVCDDQQQISAQKVVLSSCSEYFKNIAHPLICLADINYDDLTNVIDYIYQGEIQIYQECLDRFLLIAQRLKLDGLLTNKSKEDPDETINHNYEHDTKNFSCEVPDADIAAENPFIDSQSNFSGAISIPEDSSTDDVKNKVLEYLEKGENGQASCKLCGKVMAGSRNNAQNMKKHIETHLDGISFSCRKCGKQFRTSNSRQSHESKSRCHADLIHIRY